MLSKRPAVLAVMVCLIPSGLSISLAAEDWKPIDKSSLQMTEPKVEKGADAEAVFWEVKVEDEVVGGDPQVVLNHYIRIKIFNERGREEHSTVDIPYLSRQKIDRIEGRTIAPDGSVVELDKNSVYERDIVKSREIKIRAKSFAMPAVQPGSIIEYRWREIRRDQLTHNDRYEFQRDIPIQKVTYFIKPLNNAGVYGMRSLTLNASSRPFEKAPGGYVQTSMENVPAFREEPYMPPETQVRPWLFLFYSDDDTNITPQKYWANYSRDRWQNLKDRLKVDKEIKQKAEELLAESGSDEEKLRILYRFCQNEITNVFDDVSGLTAEEIEDRKRNRKPKDTLKRGMGTRFDITALFAALANAAGFDAYWAEIGDSSFYFFDPSLANAEFLPAWAAAVNLNGEWRFFDPSEAYLPAGMLRWQEEGQMALILDPKDPRFVRTPVSPPQASLERSRADLVLHEDGTLEGDVRLEFTGHRAASRRETYDDDTEEQRQAGIVARVHEFVAQAEVSEPEMEGVRETGALVYTCKVRVPGYAQVTGKRLFLKPAFFRRDREPYFTATERLHSIHFRYHWLEEDSVRIRLPEGYSVEVREAPQPFRSGEIVEYNVNMEMEDQQTLLYQRTFRFQGLLFPPDTYKPLKDMFDTLHERDGHTLLLSRKEGGGR
ncbi:MAG TPA: DUF3857 domain-containing protein [Acidobacteriota bacterium]|nr:DUF3857 domain-containing protein [Acidobacteriota bacterium]